MKFKRIIPIDYPSLRLLPFLLLLLHSCQPTYEKGTFGYDLQFLKENVETIVLQNNESKCKLAIVPQYQGRIMTSSANGLSGNSYGWINYDLISSGEIRDHINVYGGEDRFWMGPEGGQYSIFFDNGEAFEFANWQTPPSIDTEPFILESSTSDRAHFTKKLQLTNYQGFDFEIEVKRNITLLSHSDLTKELAVEFDSHTPWVGFQSENIITNIGDTKWEKNSGLLSIWILGMFMPSENTTIIIPYKDSLNLNTSYFGDIGPDRLKVTDGHIYFKGDGKYRCKIGVPPQNALPYLGSYDSKNQILTIVKYTITDDTTYVNSLWEFQEDPYAGDVINSYNDGPVENGDQLGPFYELETSSATRELAKNESIKHIHQTYHIEGDLDCLNKIARKILKVDLRDLPF